VTNNPKSKLQNRKFFEVSAALAFLFLAVSSFNTQSIAGNAHSDWVDKSPHQTAFIKVHTVRLHYLDWGGKGDTILFLHGLGDTAHIFDDLAPKFTNHFRVLGLTRRGHGQSDKPETGYDTTTLVEDIRQFLDALSIQRVVLVGHSLAGDELTRFAGLHPDRVIKLVYLDAAYDRSRLPEIHKQLSPELSPAKADMESLANFRQWVSRISFWSDAWEANLRDMMVFSADGRILREAKPGKVSRLLMQGTVDSHPDYSKIRSPALNIAVVGVSSRLSDFVKTLPDSARAKVEGALSKVKEFQQQQVEHFRKEIPDGRVIIFTNADHHCFIDKENEVLREMREFLSPTGLRESLSLSQSIAAPREVLRQGDRFPFNGGTATMTRLDTLPFVENDWTKRFRFDTAANPKLKELRERYKLEDVIAPGRDEFDKQVLLMDWVHRQFKKFGRPSTAAKGALDILSGIDRGDTFFCSHYAHVLVSSAASLGWVDRELALRRHQGAAKVGGSTEHSVTEIWSNQYRKWVMLDPTSNMYLEKDGVPLNAWEIREQWFYQNGTNLVFVIGSKRAKHKKSDLPIFLQRFAGFGDLAVHPDELDKYGFIGYIPNTDLMDSGEDYAKMFIVKDKLCDGTKWHVRAAPANPAVDPYFPIGQAALQITAQSTNLIVTLKTLTPNFKTFEIQLDNGAWTTSMDNFNWKLHPGVNRLATRCINQFGVSGPVSSAEIELSKTRD
jgi:non-heme chloroperoxidase